MFPTLLDVLSSAAQAIGAVNTVVVEERVGAPTLRGENMDWAGIIACV
jgi:shikimate 5-dehydrogenase